MGMSPADATESAAIKALLASCIADPVLRPEGTPGLDRPHATLEELAALFDQLDWPVWDRVRSSGAAPKAGEWAAVGETHLPALHFALVTLQKNKAELLETVRTIEASAEPSDDGPMFQSLLDLFLDAEDVFAGWAKMLSSARARLMAAHAKVHLDPTDD